MHDYRQVLMRLRQGDSEREIPPRQNSCRLDKILNSGAMMRETWRDTDRNSRIER